MAQLYRLATVFVFPSLYEGFGLPILEAMACGAPVIASNLTSIPEVAGDAAVLIDPNDEALFTRSLIEVLSSPEHRSKLSEAGYRRTRTFPWRRSAQMTLDVYRQVLTG